MKKNIITKITSIVVIFTTIISLFGCKDEGILLPNITGSAYEILVVINPQDWKSAGGRAVFDMLDQSVPMLPQSEPMFKISRVPHSDFDAMLRPARNILFVEVDSERYTKTSLKYYNSRWARNQALAVITTPHNDSLITFIPKHEDDIVEYFNNAERKRTITLYRKDRNGELSKLAHDRFGIDIVIPMDITRAKEGENFLWFSNTNLDKGQNVIIYSVPYTAKSQWELESLMATRDSIMKVNVPGSIKGSYLGLEKEVLQPDYKIINLNGYYCAEMRGLWKMIDGEVMGGPFISHTRLDEKNNCLITVEAFVFAPGHDKRNFMRKLESVIYSTSMPQEEDTIVITNDNK